VIGLIETWVDERGWEKMKDKMPEGWRWKCQVARREGKMGRAKGGIVTGVRRELVEREIGYDERDGIQEREVVIDRERWRFVIVYNREGQKEGLEALKEVIKEEEEGILMIAGDFNARIGGEEGWNRQSTEGDVIKEEASRDSKDKVVNKQGRDLMEVVEERGWMVLNGVKEGDEKGEWTYEKGGGRSVIDLGIVNWEAWERVGRFEVGCRGESDHQPIMIELGTYYEREEERRGEELRLQDWSVEGIGKYRTAIEKIEWKGGGVRERWEELEREINKAVEYKKRGKRKGIGWSPWWDAECRKKKREMNRLRRRYRREQGEGRYEEFVRCKKEYRKLCEEKEVEQKKREEKEVENIKTESEAWKFINKGRKKREGVCKEITMEEWVKYFRESLGGVEERKEEGSRIRGVDRVGDGGIGIEEVKNEIKRLKRGKAAGMDGIKNEAWKEGGEIIGKRLEEILKGVWEGEGFPESWRVGVVVPIWKRGERRETGNYREVTMTSTGYKVYANILNRKLVEELDAKGGWSRTQAGFRKGRGTVENVKILKYVVGRKLKQKKKVWAFFIDLKAAFDRVDRNVLWEMMRKRGVSEGLIDRVMEVYEETRCVVRIGENISREFWVEKGVRQGCPMSPTLFNIYIADIEEELKKGNGGIWVGNEKMWSIEYADDIVMLAEEEEGLRDMMRRVKRYIEGKRLELSVDKSKVMVFKNKGGRDKERFWWWGEKRIEEVKEYKYLGYVITRHGGDKEHVRERVRRARVAMGWVWSYGERKFKGDIRWRLKLFDSIVKGILLYGVEMWGYREWKEVEAIHEKYLKWILGLEKVTPGYIVREELKRNKLRVETGWRAGKFEEKLEKGEGGKFGKMCMIEKRKSEREKDRREWTKESIERGNYLWRGGMSEAAMNECGENKWECLRERDIEVDVQERGEEVRASRSCVSYRRVYGIPMYIRTCKRNEGKRLVKIARWRCGNEERGNKYWLNEEERKCRLCERERENVDHLKNKCVYVRERGGRNVDGGVCVLNEDGRGIGWMEMIERLRRDRERERERERERGE